MTTSRGAEGDLLRILDGLSGLINSARSVPMSASMIVNRGNALHLIDRVRDTVPSAIRRAEKIVADVDAVLAEGRIESERLVQYTQKGSERLVAGENIVHMTNDRTDNIMAAAEDRTASLRHGADEYSDRTLASLEAEVVKVIEQVHASREVLADRPGGDAGQPVEIQESMRRRSGWSVDPSTY